LKTGESIYAEVTIDTCTSQKEKEKLTHTSASNAVVCGPGLEKER